MVLPSVKTTKSCCEVSLTKMATMLIYYSPYIRHLFRGGGGWNVQFSSLFVIWPIWGWRLGHIGTLELSLEFGCFWLVSIKLSHQNVVQKVAETCQKEFIEHIVEHVASTTVRNLLHLTLPKLSSKENLYHFHYQHRGNTKRWCPLKISTNRIWFPCFFFVFFSKTIVAFHFKYWFPNCSETRAKHSLKEIEISPTCHAIDLKRNYQIILNKKNVIQNLFSCC